MKGKIYFSILLTVLMGLVVISVAATAAQSDNDQDDAGYEVWVIDQSNTRDEDGNGTLDSGGTLYIYQGDDLTGDDAASAVPEALDLGGAARDLCLAQTGTAPVRPHMFFFNRGRTHAVIAFVATGHVLFMDTATRTPVQCVNVGVQAHAAVPSNDQTFVVVANQNGRLLQRINTNYATNTFTLDNAATLDLATCTTPSGAPCQDPVLRPSNRPICPVIDESDNLTFVTLAGGGLFVINSKATPMSIIGEYDKNAVHPEGCGGVQANNRMYINSGGPLEADLYSFPLSGYTGANPPNTPAPTLTYTHDGTTSDSHGATRTKHDRYLWVGERFGNNITVVDTGSNAVVNQFSLVGSLSSDPAPDLMDISPSGNRIFMTLRGPIPLTGNNPAFNNAVGNTPGLGIIRVEEGGSRGTFFARVPISHIVDGVERADPHGLRVLSKN
jgi:DNA-binding beta-propeller fold protein YncE